VSCSTPSLEADDLSDGILDEGEIRDDGLVDR